MTRQKVQSSNVVSIGYDKHSRTLEVEFKSGLYRFFDVPEELANALLEAESVGKFFAKHVRGQFTSEKVTEDDTATPTKETTR